MLTIRGKRITFNRGDDIYIQMTVYDVDGQPYVLKEGDKLYFSAKTKATDKNYAIPPKEFEYDVLHLAPEDTYDLAFGTYIYDVQLITAGGRTTTILKESEMIVEAAITAYGNR